MNVMKDIFEVRIVFPMVDGEAKKCKDAWKSERYYPLFCIQLDTDCIFHDDITAASALHSLGLGNVFPTS